ncbi:MAG: B12-binding domain-containing radical SAM protein [Candidatus Omnitrophica bacterium]|nr:B12-binding domain-containing radical SAM protein [Candidatus Omnitrophota bacterium]
MSSVDILLIYPSYTYPKKSPPIGLAYVAAALERAGFSVKIIDMAVLSMDCGSLQGFIGKHKPKVVGISFMTNQYKEALNVSKVVKDVDPNISVIVGGPHASALPEETLAENSIDIVVQGEGEETIVEVMDKLMNNKKSELNKVTGIFYKYRGDIQSSGSRILIPDLDLVPFPAWHLLPLNSYSVPSTGGNRSERVFAIISSRGCPSNCIFCDSHTIFGKKFRGRSAENIFSELVYLKDNFGAAQFDFVDDTITVNKDRIHELCALILESNYKFKWMCNARVNTVNSETLKIMKKAGCVRVEFGVESGDDQVLKKLRKSITVKQIKHAHNIAREAGLSIGSFVMVGNMGEDFNSVMKTKKFLEKLETDDIYISIATPFPGTELYRVAQSKGLLRIRDWSRYVTSPTYLPEYENIMRTDKMDSPEILRAFFYLHSEFVKKKFFTRYGKFFFFNPYFYKEVIFSVRNLKELFYKIKLAIRVLVNKR